MTPVSHYLASWLFARYLPVEQRERRLISLAGIIPDIDGLGYFVDRVTEHAGDETFYYIEYHHVFGHGILVCMIVSLLMTILAKGKRIFVFIGSMP